MTTRQGDRVKGKKERTVRQGDRVKGKGQEQSDRVTG
jgi:hypothetical protein